MGKSGTFLKRPNRGFGLHRGSVIPRREGPPRKGSTRVGPTVVVSERLLLLRAEGVPNSWAANKKNRNGQGRTVDGFRTSPSNPKPASTGVKTGFVSVEKARRCHHFSLLGASQEVGMCSSNPRPQLSDEFL